MASLTEHGGSSNAEEYAQKRVVDVANLEDGEVVTLPVYRLYLKNTEGKGRGVFCYEDIPKRTLIHISPVLVLHGNESDLSQQTVLRHYTYTWVGTEQAVALGLGSMFNHHRRNNVGFIKVKQKHVIEYHTLQDVKAGTELCINYGPHLWFKDADDDDQAGNAHDAQYEMEKEEFDLLKIEV